MNGEFENLFAQFNVSRESLDKLKVYDQLLRKWQRAINLVSPKTLDESWQRHFLDSAQLSTHIDDGKIIADLGSGAGFPGLVLSILRPDLTVNLIESDQRKCEFLKTVSRETDASCHIYNERVEDVLISLKPDIITARAFASIKDILDYAAALCLESGTDFLLLKGRNVSAEVQDAQKFYHFSHDKMPSLSYGEGYILTIRDVKKHASA